MDVGVYDGPIMFSVVKKEDIDVLLCDLRPGQVVPFSGDMGDYIQITSGDVHYEHLAGLDAEEP